MSHLLIECNGGDMTSQGQGKKSAQNPEAEDLGGGCTFDGQPPNFR